MNDGYVRETCDYLKHVVYVRSCASKLLGHVIIHFSFKNEIKELWIFFEEFLLNLISYVIIKFVIR